LRHISIAAVDAIEIFRQTSLVWTDSSLFVREFRIIHDNYKKETTYFIVYFFVQGDTKQITLVLENIEDGINNSDEEVEDNLYDNSRIWFFFYY